MNTILITGTSSGLGKALVEYFADKKWNVIATSRNPKKIFEKFENVIELQLDITNWDNIQKNKIVNEKLWNQIDVVINNAGMAIVGALEETSNQQIQQVFEVNVLGTVNVIKSILPIFKQRSKGKIINISSSIGISVDIPLASVYAMSKFALEGLSEGIYYELKAHNIDLHLVEPGGFQSSLINNAIINPPVKNTIYSNVFDRLNQTLEAKSNDENALHTKIEDIILIVYQLANNEKNNFRNPVGGDTKEILKIRNETSINDYLTLIGQRFL